MILDIPERSNAEACQLLDPFFKLRLRFGSNFHSEVFEPGMVLGDLGQHLNGVILGEARAEKQSRTVGQGQA
jgi:hypothetical protein